MSEIQPARPSATVVVMDDQGSGPPLIFMGQRPSRSSFMAGAWVFPGGVVDRGEHLGAGRCRGADEAAARLDPANGLSAEAAVGLHVAAARELFEEAGILLAREGGGALWAPDPAAAVRLEEHRRALLADERTLLEVLEAEGLWLDLRDLVPFAHWLTPEVEPRRYDTYFFLAPLPPGQRAAPSPAELVASQWLSAPGALKAHAAGDLWLAPPTFRVLEELAPHGSLTAAAAARPTRLPPIMPRLQLGGEEMWVLLPGDPDYPCEAGAGVAGPTRMVLTPERCWRSVAAG